MFMIMISNNVPQTEVRVNHNTAFFMGETSCLINAIPTIEQQRIIGNFQKTITKKAVSNEKNNEIAIRINDTGDKRILKIIKPSQ